MCVYDYSYSEVKRDGTLGFYTVPFIILVNKSIIRFILETRKSKYHTVFSHRGCSVMSLYIALNFLVNETLTRGLFFVQCTNAIVKLFILNLL